jgi:hypothetical protein
MSSYSRTSRIIWYFPICDGQSHTQRKLLVAKRNKLKILKKNRTFLAME